jgi:CTP:molybdopterin cytidylyltransferase MocA
MKTAAIIPVAGLSSRMGGFKPLLPLGGQPLICRTLQSVLDGGAQRVCLVLGRDAAQVQAVLPADQRVSCVLNPRYATSDMLASVKLGLRQVLAAGRPGALFVLPGDMPAVSPATFSAMMDAASRAEADVLYPVFAGRRGHPLLVKAACYDTILDFEGDGGLRAALLPVAAQAVAVADGGVLLDADTPADYKDIQAYTGRQP